MDRATYTKTLLDPSETLMKDKNVKQDCTWSKYTIKHKHFGKKTHRNEDSIQRESFLCTIRQESWGLTTESKPIEDTGRTEQEAVASGESTGKDSAIDNMRQD